MPTTPTTADLLIDELMRAGNALLDLENHEGACTNEGQKKIAPKIPHCTKCSDTIKKREKRFREALDQLSLLRDMFNV